MHFDICLMSLEDAQAALEDLLAKLDVAKAEEARESELEDREDFVSSSK